MTITSDIQAHIEKRVAEAPPLTPHQLAVITAALQLGLRPVAKTA